LHLECPCVYGGGDTNCARASPPCETVPSPFLYSRRASQCVCTHHVVALSIQKRSFSLSLLSHGSMKSSSSKEEVVDDDGVTMAAMVSPSDKCELFAKSKTDDDTCLHTDHITRDSILKTSL
jgi:hypothetical protein